MATSPLKVVASIETVLKDVRAVLQKMLEDKQALPFEQRSELSGCFNEIAHALLAIQDDGSGLRARVERREAIGKRGEPPTTGIWTRFRGLLLPCVEKAADTNSFTTEEEEGIDQAESEEPA